MCRRLSLHCMYRHTIWRARKQPAIHSRRASHSARHWRKRRFAGALVAWSGCISVPVPRIRSNWCLGRPQLPDFRDPQRETPHAAAPCDGCEAQQKPRCCTWSSFAVDSVDRSHSSSITRGSGNQIILGYGWYGFAWKSDPKRSGGLSVYHHPPHVIDLIDNPFQTSRSWWSNAPTVRPCHHHLAKRPGTSWYILIAWYPYFGHV